MVILMPSSGNQDTEASLSPDGQENTERNSGFKTQITKKDSRSACDLRVPRDSSPYTEFFQLFIFGAHLVETA